MDYHIEVLKADSVKWERVASFKHKEDRDDHITKFKVDNSHDIYVPILTRKRKRK